MEQPLISIIVPVYNAEPYLDNCLDSIAAQTWGNLEVWLVDDGSTDASPALCDARAAADERPEKQRALGHTPPAASRGELIVNTDNRADDADCNKIVQHVLHGCCTSFRISYNFTTGIAVLQRNQVKNSRD